MAQPNPIAGKRAIDAIEQPRDARQTRRRHQPSEPYRIVGLPNRFHTTHDATIGQDTMQNASYLWPRQAVAGRIKAQRGNIFHRQPAPTIAPTEPLDFTAAERAVAIVEQFHSPLGHDPFLLAAT
jgi:hypothetical protein